MSQSEQGEIVRRVLARRVALGVVLFLVACKSEATKQAELQALVAQKEAQDQAAAAKKQAEDQAAAEKKKADELAVLQQAEERLKNEKAQAEARTRAQILATPDAFLQVTESGMVDNGFLDSQRQLNKLTVTNRTAYP